MKVHKCPPAEGGYGGTGDKRQKYYLHEAGFLVSLKLFKMPTNCQSGEKDNIKT